MPTVWLGGGCCTGYCVLGAITTTRATTLLLLIGVGGFVLHIQTDPVGQGTIVIRRLIQGLLPKAPLPLSSIGLLRLLVLFDPNERW